MNRYYLLLPLCLLLILSSCVTSVHCLVTYDKAVAENRISGHWKYDNTNIEVEPMTSSKLLRAYKEAGKDMFGGLDKQDSILFTKSYILSYEKEKLEYSFIGSLIKLNGELFIDFFPLNADSTGKNDLGGFIGSSSAGTDYIVTHSIARLSIKNNNLMELEFIDDHFIKEQIETGKAAIKHEKDDLFNTLLITASSESLQQFLLKYGRDERLFSRENAVTLEKV